MRIKLKKKDKPIFKTWDNMCLLKLKELGKTTMAKWSQAMGLNYSHSLSSVARRLGDKIKIITYKESKRGKFYEVNDDE